MANLLASAARLKVLVTSRGVLRLQGEQEFSGPPLSVPDLKRPLPASCVVQYEAVALFLQRAWKVQPEFRVTDGNAAALAAICCRLDGLLLAIELAAARVKLFPPRELLTRLESRLKLLTGGARDLPVRHQTLRGAIAWSFDLLADGEKKLFRSCRSSRGAAPSRRQRRCATQEAAAKLQLGQLRCTLEAAEAVCDAEGDLGIDILEGIASLVDQSLLRRNEPGEGSARFTMLETIREFGQECLAQSGEEEVIQRNHARFFLVLAEEAEPELVRENQSVWLARLKAEHDNLRAALTRAVGREPETALRLAGALWRFWVVQDCSEEGREALERALERGAKVPVAVRTKALQAAARLTWNLERLKELVEEGVQLSRALEDKKGYGFWLCRQAWLAMLQRDREAAREFAGESLAISREVGDRLGLAEAARILGELGCGEHDHEAAPHWHEESLAIYREIGDKYGMASQISVLGLRAFQVAEYATADRLYQESLPLLQEIGSRRQIAWSIYGLGDVALVQGRYEAACGYLEESLALFRDLGNRKFIAWSLDSLGEVKRCQGEYQTARVLFEEMLAIAREMGSDYFIGHTLFRLGSVAWGVGEEETARRYYDESLLLLRQTRGGEESIHLPFQGLGDVAYAEGDYDRARAFYGESLTILQRRKDKGAMARPLERLARVATAEGEPRQAARLFGAAQALRDAIGAPLAPAEHLHYDGSVAAARAALGEKAFMEAWAEGQALTLGQVIAEALEGPPTAHVAEPWP